MKTVSDLLVQFVGFLLQTAPVVFFCVITIREVSSAYSARRLLLHACGIELLGGALFTALCGWGAGTGQLMLLCNLFMIAMLVAVLIWLKHVSRVNLCQLAILGTLFVHYAAVVYTCNGICFFLLGSAHADQIFPYSMLDIPVYFVCNLCYLPLFMFFLKKWVFPNLFTLDKLMLRNIVRATLLILLVFCAAAGYIDWDHMELWNVVLLVLVIVTDIAVCYMFFSMVLISRKNKETEVTLLLLRNQQERLKRNMKAVSVMHHDIRHHIRMIKSLMAEGKQEALLAYVNSYEASVEQMEAQSFCAYLVADELLKYYAQAMKKYAIKLETNFENIRADYPFNPADMTSLISNGLENAVEECLRLPEGKERIVHFWMKQTQRKVLLLEIRNPCLEDGQQGQESEAYLSRKGHGVGLTGVALLAQKYHGDVDYQKKDGEFIFRVILPMEAAAEQPAP